MKQWRLFAFRDSVVMVAPYNANMNSSPAKATASGVEDESSSTLKFWIMFD